jgi:glycosyltransferase involved in cell wall biosynthesis
MDQTGISIIINNFNYARFLAQAIESVLAQTMLPAEVIVVDDGSTDNSKEVLSAYQDRVRIIYKENGGQASAFNAGFKASRCAWIWFLDADDFLNLDAVKNVSQMLFPDVVKVQAPLILVNETGVETGGVTPFRKLSDGYVKEELLEHGDYTWPPTSGNIFSRSMLESCLPMPEIPYRLCADFYLCSFAGVSGKIKSLQTPVGYYRVHGNNSFYGFSFNEERLKRNGVTLITAITRIEELIRTAYEMPEFTYPYNRAMLESLVISHRFGRLRLPDSFNKINIYRKWMNTPQVRSIKGRARAIAFGFWTILNFAPRPLAKWAIMQGIRKSKKNAHSEL